jgi:polysaccharide deacetylase 2 family uncharacterized protein YibQ
VAADDLSSPLGQNSTRKLRDRLPLAIPRAIAGLLGLSLAVFVGWAAMVDDPFGGEPSAVASVDLRAAEGGKAADTPTRPAEHGGPHRPNRYDGPAMDSAQPGVAPAPAPAPVKTVTIIDGTSGKRQEVVIGGGADGKSPLNEQLIEPSRHGPLPKVAQDGSRPSEVYARSVKVIPNKPNARRVAIIVGGLGVGAAATSDAIRKLPGPVTLAIAPYGGSLDQLAARARSQGHEILLQVPMEPFDYPDNDPGPQTLLTSLDPGQNLDRLHWAMSRFQGYVGIANYMGARFTSLEQALGPVLRDVGNRGLIYVDDGASPRSLASQIASANGLPFAKADVVIDSVPNPVDIDRALGRLENIARERGMAVGIATALPVAIEHIARWAKAAEDRGILLVPITAAANKAKQS